MRKVTFCLVVLGVLALAFICGGYPFPGYPPQFAPSRTSRPRPAQRSLVPATKFLKVQNPVSNKYIVVLNDDVVSSNGPTDLRRQQVNAIANALAQAHGGQRGFVYESALKGFSIELPNEAAAIALSQNPQVKWVEEDGVVQEGTCESTPPWGLDRIDQMGALPAGGVDATSYLSTYSGAAYCSTNNGSGVDVYVIDRGVLTSHSDLSGRTLTSIDCTGSTMGNASECVNDTLTSGSGHGTHVAAIAAGTTYGTAKGATIRSLRTSSPASTVIAAVNWATADHNASPSTPAVANISLYCSIQSTQNNPDFSGCGNSIDTAVQGSINAGVTYSVVAGNGTNNDNVAVNANTMTPADVVDALTVAATTLSDAKPDFSNYGSIVDLFAPGVHIPSAWNGSNTDHLVESGTSMASPHVAGAVALYLQGRTGASSSDCFSLYNNPVPDTSVTGSTYAKVSTCPDRVTQFIKSNATLSSLSSIGTGSPNRLLYMGSLPAPTNPIDNQPFFVWQHYGDFEDSHPEPDESGLSFWTSQITSTCSTGFNDNDSCTDGKRIDVSLAFWVDQYASWFTTSYGLATNTTTSDTANTRFIIECYKRYLRRTVTSSDSGVQYWVSDMTSSQHNYGDPSNADGVRHLIAAFITSTEYRERLGQP